MTSCSTLAALGLAWLSVCRACKFLALCRPDCNETTGDEDELVAACQDVMRGIETGDVSKEDVKRAKAEVRKVSTDRHCTPGLCFCQSRIPGQPCDRPCSPALG